VVISRRFAQMRQLTGRKHVPCTAAPGFESYRSLTIFVLPVLFSSRKLFTYSVKSYEITCL